MALPPLLNAEQTAEVLDIPVAAIGLLVRDHLLHFYRGVTFLREDVLRVRKNCPARLIKLRDESERAANAHSVPQSPWRLTTTNE